MHGQVPGGSGHPVCVKCKVKRQIYITDEDPATLERYKMCDACRNKNKQYKRKRKLQKQRIRIETPPALGVLPNQESHELESPVAGAGKAPEGSLESFLYPISNNSNTDVDNLKFSMEIPAYIIPRLDSESQKLGEYVMSTVENERRISDYRDSVKDKLRLHYLDRVFDIIDGAGYSFKTRSTNWKNTKFYAQMLCSQDVAAKKRDPAGRDKTPTQSSDSDDAGKTSQGPFACKSHLNYSFNAATGAFGIDFSHLSHKSLMNKDPAIQTVPKAHSAISEWADTLEHQAEEEVSSSEEERWQMAPYDHVQTRVHQEAAEEATPEAEKTVPEEKQGNHQKDLDVGLKNMQQNFIHALSNTSKEATKTQTNRKSMSAFASALNSLHNDISSR